MRCSAANVSPASASTPTSVASANRAERRSCRALIGAMVATVGGVANRATRGVWCASPCARVRATRPDQGAWGARLRRWRCVDRGGLVGVAGPRGREDPLRVHRHVLAHPHQRELGRRTRDARGSPGRRANTPGRRPARRARRRGRRPRRARAGRHRRPMRHVRVQVADVAERRHLRLRSKTSSRYPQRSAKSTGAREAVPQLLELDRGALLSALAQHVDHLAVDANPGLGEARSTARRAARRRSARTRALPGT